MSKYPEEHETDQILHQGLRSLPVPEVSADFDARVRAALRRPTPWWRKLWVATRPVLAAAACSLVVTLALLQGFASNPATFQPSSRPLDTNVLASEHGRGYWDMLDGSVERMDLSNLSRRVFLILWWPMATKSQYMPPLLPRTETTKPRS